MEIVHTHFTMFNTNFQIHQKTLTDTINYSVISLISIISFLMTLSFPRFYQFKIQQNYFESSEEKLNCEKIIQVLLTGPLDTF